MPNRIIKETIRTSKSINAMTDFQFRVWTYLLTYVDDYGRGSADPELLKGLVFPRQRRLTESAIEDALVNLARIGSIVLYEVDGESYLYFPNWGDHQRIQRKYSKFPDPPAENNPSQKSTVNHGESPPESNPIQSKSNPEAEAETHTREAAAAAECTRIEAYAAANLDFLSPTNMDELVGFVDDLSDELVRHAVDEACAAGKRTWNYVRSILRRYLSAGYKTLGEVRAAEAKREQQKQQPEQKPEPKPKDIRWF